MRSASYGTRKGDHFSPKTQKNAFKPRQDCKSQGHRQQNCQKAGGKADAGVEEGGPRRHAVGAECCISLLRETKARLFDRHPCELRRARRTAKSGDPVTARGAADLEW